MIIEGNAIAREILTDVKQKIKESGIIPRLTVFTCAPNFETQKFLNLKQKRAAEVGIQVELRTLDANCTTEMVVAAISECLPVSDGVIVQLPFPAQVDANIILAAVPVSHDVDVLRYAGEATSILPPVVGAIDEISTRESVVWRGKRVVVVGTGRLVGAPSACYARNRGSEVIVVTRETAEAPTLIASADILILGAGVPGLITAHMVKPGVVVFDAGTTEEGGVLVGDATTEVAMVATLVTPVPGGIGPITVAILLKNLLLLKKMPVVK